MTLRTIEKRWEESKPSVFAFALELSSEDLECLKNAAERLTEEDLKNCRHALLAYWFRRYYDNSNGRDFQRISPFYGLSENLWQTVMGQLPLNRSNFIANCWMLNAATGINEEDRENRGWTSDIWWNVRRVISCDDPENRFDIAEYGEELKPYMKNLLEYCADPENPVGRDFRSFVEDYTTGAISAEQGWKSKLKESFDTRFKDGANLGFYLYWDGGERADYIVGLDHFRGKTKQLFFYDEQGTRIGDGRTVQPPFMSWKLPDQQKIAVKYSGFKHTFNRDDYDKIRVFFPAPAQELKHWWQFAGGTNPRIPYNRNTILIRGVAQDAEIQIPETEFSTKSFGLTLNGESVNCLKITFASRPERDTECQGGDLSYTLAGARPAIEIVSGKREDITSPLQLPVCSGVIRLQGTHMPENGGRFHWQCSSPGNATINSEGELSGLPEDSVSIVSVSLRDGDNRAVVSMKLLHLPVNMELRESEISQEEEVEERKQQRQRLSCSNPDGKNFECYRKDTSFFWWFEEGFSCRPENIKQSPKFSSSNFEQMSLCIPNDLLERDGGVSIQIGNETKTFGREQCGLSSYAFLRLDELLRDICKINGYIYEDEAGEDRVTCDGKTLFQFDRKPFKPYLCQNRAGDWGVFLPESKRNLSYRVLLYSDAWEKICSGPLYLVENGSHNGRETFVSLKDKLEKEEKNDPDGEWFLALSMNHLHAGESDNILLSMDFPSNCTQMICIRPENAVWNGNPAVKALLHTENIPESHPFRKSRLYKFATSPEPIPYEECHPFWLASAGYPERLGTTLHTLLLSGYNFLAEPKWFFQALQNMRKKCPAAHGGQRLTRALRDSIDKELIDNQDRDAAFQGKGLCSAIVAQEQIDQFVPLNPGAGNQNRFNQFRVVRELSRLNGSRVINLGIKAHYTDDFHSYSRLVTGTRLERQLVFLDLERGLSLWMNRLQPENWECDDGCLSFKNFSLDSEIFSHAVQEKPDWEPSEKPLCSKEEQEKLDGLLKSMVEQSNLTECAKAMVRALHRTEFCDYAVISTVGLIISVHNTVCWNSVPKDWPLKPDNADGKLLCDIVRRLFEDKLDDLNDGEPDGDGNWNWRTLMRSIVPMMWLFSYFNRGGNTFSR